MISCFYVTPCIYNTHLLHSKPNSFFGLTLYDYSTWAKPQTEILLQVHLQKTCYDFYFAYVLAVTLEGDTVGAACLSRNLVVSERPRSVSYQAYLDRSLSLSPSPLLPALSVHHVGGHLLLGLAPVPHLCHPSLLALFPGFLGCPSLSAPPVDCNASPRRPGGCSDTTLPDTASNLSCLVLPLVPTPAVTHSAPH